MEAALGTIIEISKAIGALGVIFGLIFCIVRWFDRQEKHTTDIKKLEAVHNSDLKSVQEELCILNYAVLASLDALMQRGYGGKVTEAHDKLQKHLNQSAHLLS